MKIDISKMPADKTEWKVLPKDNYFYSKLYDILWEQYRCPIIAMTSFKVDAEKFTEFVQNNCALIEYNRFSNEDAYTVRWNKMYLRFTMTEKGKNLYATYFYPRDEVQTDDLKNILEEMTYIEKEDEINVYLLKGGQSLNFEAVEIAHEKCDITLNYGEAFSEKYNKLCDIIRQKKEGLITLHGSPGTGKTTLIKNLISDLGKDRKFLIIPSNMIQSLLDPNMLSVLMNFKKAVLILEDAEVAILSRDDGNMHGASMVSTLLNMSDGLVGKALEITFLVTYNTGKERLDSALLRKGRLLFDHKFRALQAPEAQKLIDYLGFEYTAYEDMSLADIYNVNKENFLEEEDVRKYCI